MDRTTKDEFCLDSTLKTKQLTTESVKQAIELYNNYRAHLALSWKTPTQLHQKTQPPEAVGSI